MYITINEILTWFILSMSFLLSVIFIINRKSFNHQEKAFGFFLIINSIFELIAWFSVSVFNVENNLPGLHLYTLFEFLCITKFATSSLKQLQGLPAKIILVAGSLFIISNSIWIQNIYTYNSISITAVKIFTIVMSVLFFYRMLSSKRYSIVQTRPSVYFFTAIFLNACTSMIWYMYSNQILLLSDEMNIQLSIMKSTSTAIANLIILIGLYYATSRKENDII